MATIEKFEDMEVWQHARSIAKAVYIHSKQGQFSKDYGLRDQIQRAAVSIMSKTCPVKYLEEQNDVLNLCFYFNSFGERNLRAPDYMSDCNVNCIGIIIGYHGDVTGRVNFSIRIKYRIFPSNFHEIPDCHILPF